MLKLEELSQVGLIFKIKNSPTVFIQVLISHFHYFLIRKFKHIFGRTLGNNTKATINI